MKKHKLTFLATSILMGLIPLLVAAVTISIAESAAATEAEARQIEVINNEAKDNLSHLIEANKNTVTISEDVVTGINEANIEIAK